MPQTPPPSSDPRTPEGSSRQAIPLQNLPRPPDVSVTGPGGYRDDVAGLHYGGDFQDTRARHQRAPPTAGQMAANLPAITTYWDQPYAAQEDNSEPDSPIDPLALQYALPPDIQQDRPDRRRTVDVVSIDPYDTQSPYYDEPHNADTPTSEPGESDRMPLTAKAQPISGAALTPGGEAQGRDSLQTVDGMDSGEARPRGESMLGYDLERGSGSTRHHHFGSSLTPTDQRRSRSPSTVGALQRTASMVRAMSQRVVNIGGEGELLEQQARRSRSRSRSPSVEGRPSQHVSRPMLVDTSYQPQVSQPASEKGGVHASAYPEPPPPQPPPPPPQYRRPMANPLKGKSLGVFSPNNPIRLRLCDLLVHPWTEPLILCLIVLQAVLLAVQDRTNVFDSGDQPPRSFASSPTEWAVLVLFLIFTAEVIVRIIVSGFIFNAPEYTTPDPNRPRGFRDAVTYQYKSLFKPQRQKSVRATAAQPSYGPSTFARSFTMLHGQAMPASVKDQQRLQLARRAFLRHGFNRLDFVAVVSFWISFFVTFAGVEQGEHVYVFRMLSSLRILRLLAMTRGNAIILRSLKKAAPLLLRVSFLIGFFWLLFAIIGVQSFKQSLKRTCVWLDPQQPTDISASYTNNFTFCGGHLDNATTDLTALPWVFSDTGSLDDLQEGATSGKGFICPRGSICLQQDNPYNGTVNFDNIVNSIELVFVIMSANTFTDLMYYTTNSDYLAAALFFGAGIMFMMLWMTSLLISVITSSFQVIREESKSSAFTDNKEPVVPPHPADEPLRRASTLKRIYDRIAFIWVIAIAVDLLAQCFRSSTMPAGRANLIDATEIIVTTFLDIEIVIRFAADWRRFHRRHRNLVDLGLVLATTIIILPPIRDLGQTYAWLTIFQILRIYRVVLAVPITRSLIQLVLGNAAGIGNLVLFVFLMTFFVSIFASQLFRGQIALVNANGNYNQVTFATIFNSFLGMYQLLSSENWTAVLYNVTASTTGYKTAWIGATFLIGWFILAFFLLVNMFIAVIQENFDVSEDMKRMEQVKAFLQRKELGSSSGNLALSTIFSFGRDRKRRDPLDYGPATMEMLLKEAVVQEFLDEAMDPLQRAQTDDQTPTGGANPGPVSPGIASTVWGKFVSLFGNTEPNPFYSSVRFSTPGENFDPRRMAREAVNASAVRRKAQRAYLDRHPTYNNSLYLFAPENPIRHLCQRLVGPGRGTERIEGVEPNKIAWYTFSTVIYLSIVAMVILACVTTPLYQKEYFNTHVFSVQNWFVWTDMAFAIVFSAEVFIKVIADGFFWTPHAYFRSPWGIIDAIVLITLWINVFTLFANDGAVSRAVGAFKALRALRLLNLSESSRETFHSLLIVGAWKILSAAFVSLSLIIPFGIYALNLFNGQLLSCNDTSDGIVNLTDCYGEWNSTPYNNNWPLLAPRAAKNPYFDFDDFGSSLFTLFQIVSQEGWIDVTYAVQSIAGRGLQPVWGIAQGNAVLFVVFNLLATVFVLTLFISVFMRNYTEQTGVAFLTAEQRSWLELRKRLRQISPSKTSYNESTGKIKKWCHKRAIEKRGKWYVAITVVLVLHLLLLLLEYAQEPAWWRLTRDIIFLVLTLIYIANMAIRITGLGWSRFRRSSWDLYSLVAVFGAFATSILFLSNGGLNTYVQLHKFFLVTIVLLLIPRNDALDQLFKTAAASLTTIANLVVTWLIFYLVFAIAMTQTFSLTRFGANETNNLNFRDVPKALILLFRMTCGEGWNQIMKDFASIEAPLCVEGDTFFDSDCGSGTWARVLFTAWNIIGMYIFVNLFISLIFESFSYVYQRSSGLAGVDRDEIRRFKEAWRSVDPTGTGFISKAAFPRLLGELSGVFEMRIYDAQDSVRSILEDVRGEPTGASRHASVGAQSGYAGVDLKRLNERLAQIDVARVHERRRRFNIFFEEVLVSADPDKGIAFTTVLMILAHYNVISDSKSLRLDEFLRRRARLQRVEEEVHRRIVLGFFNTVYWSRRFKRHKQAKGLARMTAVPQLDVPDIFVNDEDDREEGKAGAADATDAAARTSGADFLGVGAAASARAAPHRSWSGIALDLPSPDSTGSSHPLSRPRAPSSPSALAPDDAFTVAGGDGGHRHRGSAFSFDLQEPLSSRPGSGHSSRRGSAVSPAQVRELLDDSIWVESIRRSVTVRKSDNWGGFR